VIAVALAGCGDDEETLEAPAPTPAEEQTTPATPTQEQAAKTPGGCEQVTPPAPREPERSQKPDAGLDSSKTWTLNVKTNCGDFTITLDLNTAPNASASLVSLARSGYFDGTIFHRIAPGFVIQGGDPTATGNGGPGYKTVDKPPADARYTRGVVAMAKTQTERPGTGGSQFFVVTAADSRLPADYAVVGAVTEGLGVVRRIGRLGNQAQQPTEPVVISTVEVAGR
jgi:cyclophilin family peptidyl-prolyl cis-trans isomerase